MSHTKELLLIQLAHAKQAIERARNNRYSDLHKQNYQDKLFQLFERVEDYVSSNLEKFKDDPEVYDGPKKHLDFIFKSLEFLDNSTLNQIPYEIVECLKHAMNDWVDLSDPKDNYIIVTSLINDVVGFSYERRLAIEDDLYNDINTKYGIEFSHRLVQINLPRAFVRDYIATVVLYHELGHFIDSKYSVVAKLYFSLLNGIYLNAFTDEELKEIKHYLPDLTSYIDNKPRPDYSKIFNQYIVSLRHIQEYFCDLFAAQYIGNASNLYVSYLAESGKHYSESHPSATNRDKIVKDYQEGQPNIIVRLINFALQSIGKPQLQKRFVDSFKDDFFNLVPPVITNKAELHGILNYAWRVWLNDRDKMIAVLNVNDNLRCYTAINNLIEKSIGNFIAINEWNKACKELKEPEAPAQLINAGKQQTSYSTIAGNVIKEDIIRLREEHQLFIRPLLTEDQIGEVSIDFRLGYDFLVSVQGRDAFINASKNEWIDRGTQHNIKHFFQSTRRQLGETFILHPHQTVLAVTLEYVKLPDDCMLELVMRSSYARLGITINTIAQPGYVGCLNLELTNNNNNPINLAVGARVIQGILHRIAKPAKYFHSPRKYVCQVRPEPSAVINDKDLTVLNQLWKQNNNQPE